ncbi:MAG: hypothetical protein R8M37_04520 [Alphaproteobacteria bacterium]|nr:hypothetical protein [Alphaproteobacteria bacterium]
MKKLKNIFIGFFVVCAVTLAPVFAADNGCDDPDNDAIVAELALCSTHAYNIGVTQNPTGADRELMREVVAMKTTLITQQMYKQYQQMESMLRRLKTQLQKAVLNTKLQVAGADSSSGGSGGSGGRFESSDRNVYLAGIENCMNLYDDEKILECYQKNLTTLVNSSKQGSDPSPEIKKQLANDYTNLKAIVFGGEKSACTEYSDGSDGKDLCVNSKMKNKEFKDTCLNRMRTCLQNQTRAYRNNQAKLSKD